MRKIRLFILRQRKNRSRAGQEVTGDCASPEPMFGRGTRRPGKAGGLETDETHEGFPPNSLPGYFHHPDSTTPTFFGFSIAARLCNVDSAGGRAGFFPSVGIVGVCFT